MAKAARFECERCEQRLAGGIPFCKHCGYPTGWASHEDRTAWEVAQYRHKTATVPMGYAYEPAKPPAPSAAPQKSRGIAKLFGRRQQMPPFPAAMPKRATQPQLTVVPEAPPAPKVAARPAARDARPAPKPRSAAARPSSRAAVTKADESAAVVAARLLNARVAELDAQVQQLRSELSAMRGADASIAQ